MAKSPGNTSGKGKGPRKPPKRKGKGPADSKSFRMAPERCEVVRGLLARQTPSHLIEDRCSKEWGITTRQVRVYLAEVRRVINLEVQARAKRNAADIAAERQELREIHRAAIFDAFREKQLSVITASGRELARLGDLYPNPLANAPEIGVTIVLPGPKSPEQWESDDDGEGEPG